MCKVFPNTQQQLYIFHIVKNVILNAKYKFITSGSGPNSNDKKASNKEKVTLTAVKKTTLAITHRAEATTKPRVLPSQPASVLHNYYGVIKIF